MVERIFGRVCVASLHEYLGGQYFAQGSTSGLDEDNGYASFS